MINFVDGVDPCHAFGHNLLIEKDWHETKKFLYIKKEKCTICKKIKKYIRYKWLPETTEWIDEND